MGKLVDRNVFVTAGHHNADPGAVQNGAKEADLTKELRDLICEGTNFFKDSDAWNLNRTILWLNSNKRNIDINADIHFNSVANRQATGVEVIVANNASSNSRSSSFGFLTFGMFFILIFTLSFLYILDYKLILLPALF
jgi:N-acetylmuramoyl-L-alanine amidase